MHSPASAPSPSNGVFGPDLPAAMAAPPRFSSQPVNHYLPFQGERSNATQASRQRRRKSMVWPHGQIHHTPQSGNTGYELFTFAVPRFPGVGQFPLVNRRMSTGPSNHVPPGPSTPKLLKRRSTSSPADSNAAFRVGSISITFFFNSSKSEKQYALW